MMVDEKAETWRQRRPAGRKRAKAYGFGRRNFNGKRGLFLPATLA